ncbi:uncharacterized protein [Drosophila bipectinata]|uniref:uncharacterized protein n=1 Tax=Drosophila bipectinata TaxID=42026 RepID=UPI001C8A7E69|nr:uncharacterized protein LOC108131266 [Drosophila bipectinata]
MTRLKLKLFVLSLLVESYICLQVVRLDRFTFDADDPSLFVSHLALLDQGYNRSYLTGHVVLTRDLNELLITSSMDIIRPHRPEMRLYKVTLNFCSILTNAYKNKFIKTMYHGFATFLDVRPKCPLKANLNYSYARAYIDEKLIPNLIPDCTYRLKMSFQQKSKQLAHMQLDGRLITKF